MHFNAFHLCTLDLSRNEIRFTVCPTNKRLMYVCTFCIHCFYFHLILYLVYTLLLFSFNFSIPCGSCCMRNIFYEGILLYSTCMPWTHIFWPTRTHTTPNTGVNPHICIKQNTSVHATKHTHTHCKKNACNIKHTYRETTKQAFMRANVYTYIYMYIYI